MAAYNNFTFVGICYKDAERIATKESTPKNPIYYTHITLVVKSSKKNWKKQYIPIMAIGGLAEKASLVCRNGFKVAITGEVMTNEYVDKFNGEFKVEVRFIATDIMLIEKIRRTRAVPRDYCQRLELSSIDPFEPPHKRE